jgi:hypothetical protein
MLTCIVDFQPVFELLAYVYIFRFIRLRLYGSQKVRCGGHGVVALRTFFSSTLLISQDKKYLLIHALMHAKLRTVLNLV